MRCKRWIAVLLAAVFLLGTVAPAIAEDGKRFRLLEEKVKDHPWQDDCSDGGDKPGKALIGIAIGPITFTIRMAIPLAQKPTQARVSASKPTTSKSVEKGK